MTDAQRIAEILCGYRELSERTREQFSALDWRRNPPTIAEIRAVAEESPIGAPEGLGDGWPEPVPIAPFAVLIAPQAMQAYRRPVAAGWAWVYEGGRKRGRWFSVLGRSAEPIARSAPDFIAWAPMVVGPMPWPGGRG